MKNNWIRLLAGALVSVLLVGAFALTGGMKSGKSTDGLLYQASGLHPDGEMLVIDGQIVPCEEYLYWVGSICDYISAQLPDVDWSADIPTAGMTYGDYVKLESVAAVKQTAVACAWAQQAGITLTEQELAQLDAQIQALEQIYGEDYFDHQLSLMGLSRDTYRKMLQDQYLYQKLEQTFCTAGSALYPDDAALTDYASQNGYATFCLLTLTGDNAETMAADLLERWQAAEDKAAEYAAICSELQQDGGSVTLAASEGDPLSDAIMALELEEMTSVVDPYGSGECYVALRTDLDLPALVETYFGDQFNARLDSAAVVSNAKLYNALDVGAFYEKLTALRTELSDAYAAANDQTGATDTDTTDGDTDTTGTDAAADTDTEPAA